MEVVVIFDFDKTIIECDSDEWVVDNFGLTQLYNQLLPTMPNSSLMDRMVEELQLRGKTIQEIVECLRKIPLSPNMISAIHSAYASGCDLRIISDANTLFIETILMNHGILHCFSEINTNSALLNQHGNLQILPNHDFTTSTHGCTLCPSNLCKGQIIERIRASFTEKQIIYVGDGTNDYCPSLKLTAKDFVMPRKNFQLWHAISSNPNLIKAVVKEWNNWEELKNVLINLINDSKILKENHNQISEEFLPSHDQCKFQTRPMAMARSPSKRDMLIFLTNI